MVKPGLLVTKQRRTANTAVWVGYGPAGLGHGEMDRGKSGPGPLGSQAVPGPDAQALPMRHCVRAPVRRRKLVRSRAPPFKNPVSIQGEKRGTADRHS
jgi:hypothetical protein